jgi:predicted nucleic acid-binding protein
MPQSKILVDTNAYLRLAKTIRPLLFVPFGDNEYCLYIIPELNKELLNRRFETKFPWIDEEEYRENRKFFPKISNKQKKSIQDTFDHIWNYVVTKSLDTSKVDALYIAYALESDVPVVTDDKDMTQLAHEFDAKVMPTLQLLKIMLDCGHTNMKTIDGLIEYWRYISDRPFNMESDYKKYFK